MLFTALIAIILIAAWVILAGSSFVQGGVVERPIVSRSSTATPSASSGSCGR